MTNTDRLNRVIHAIRTIADPDIVGKMPFGPSAIIGARVADLLIHGNEMAEADVVNRVLDEFELRRPARIADLLN